VGQPHGAAAGAQQRAAALTPHGNGEAEAPIDHIALGIGQVVLNAGMHVVARHLRHRGAGEHPPAIQRAAIEQHPAEAIIIGYARCKPAAAGVE
jgi:hypothetical protein